MPYTPQEEHWNAWSHAFGALLALIAGTLFIRWSLCTGDAWATFGLTLYLFGMLASYGFSAIYHAMPLDSPKREKLRRWDHAAIYWHIAGSYSPITLVAMRHEGIWGWTLFAFVWTAAIAGTVATFRKLKSHSHLETASFCLMGLSILVAFKPLLNCVSMLAVAWIVAEGVCDLIGVFFYSLRRRYMHTVFHFFILAGSVCHIIALYDILF